MKAWPPALKRQRKGKNPKRSDINVASTSVIIFNQQLQGPSSIMPLAVEQDGTDLCAPPVVPIVLQHPAEPVQPVQLESVMLAKVEAKIDVKLATFERNLDHNMSTYLLEVNVAIQGLESRLTAVINQRLMSSDTSSNFDALTF